MTLLRTSVASLFFKNVIPANQYCHPSRMRKAQTSQGIYRLFFLSEDPLTHSLRSARDDIFIFLRNRAMTFLILIRRSLDALASLGEG